jgi:hypothetical protein
VFLLNKLIEWIMDYPGCSTSLELCGRNMSGKGAQRVLNATDAGIKLIADLFG